MKRQLQAHITCKCGNEVRVTVGHVNAEGGEREVEPVESFEQDCPECGRSLCEWETP